MTFRKARLTPEGMDQAQAALYARIASGARAAESAFALVDEKGALVGPFDALLLDPPLGEAIQAFGAVLRFQGRLSARSREMAILLIGHYCESAFEVRSHEAVARRVGLTADELVSLAELEPPPSASVDETVVANAVLQLLRTGTLDDAAYGSCVAELTEAGVLEITALVGYYRFLADVLAVFAHDR
ncbi:MULTISPECIES: carboxymuconolactone decarboxylase family protein [unclassified Microbacterium]|uniref:carboxymuconolactone decarboxylase family protein n=1 Tax=unclassified Microbacterium TaxID=2609290 RepID=UPI00214BDB32|nr:MULTISPECIES: carboxymuconolactone decarboxylase family protein [unclassified Microbacterium]MCR2811330.1 carboxymuconolactone decarboxylase family protein [Microbacterium sp. zg.B185]WIM19487.1 carboxymuconolactone decarboxylase family protein [Microbacterium sp. zg-B185]